MVAKALIMACPTADTPSVNHGRAVSVVVFLVCLTGCGKSSTPTTVPTPQAPDTADFVSFRWSNPDCTIEQSWTVEVINGSRVDTIAVRAPDAVYCGRTDHAYYLYQFDKRLPLAIRVWRDDHAIERSSAYPRQDSASCALSNPRHFCDCVPNVIRCYPDRVEFETSLDDGGAGGGWPPAALCEDGSPATAGRLELNTRFDDHLDRPDHPGVQRLP